MDEATTSQRNLAANARRDRGPWRDVPMDQLRQRLADAEAGGLGAAARSIKQELERRNAG
ncbi:hypothetical protein [Primorskyibacter sp. S87]|uniref:hypothetical protein n=1 Tax=Primorskyibacter sp. S87 TaxID=3415126 RepID=UPI003C7D3D54